MLDWLFGERSKPKHGIAEVCTGPQLCLIWVAENFLALHNEGTAPAHKVRVDPQRSSIVVATRADEPFDLAPGDSWTFLIEDLGPWVEAGWQVTVTCDDQADPVCVPLPVSVL